MPHLIIDDGHLPDEFVSNYDLSDLKLKADKAYWSERFRRRFVKLTAYLCRINYGKTFSQDQDDARSKEPMWSNCVFYFYHYFAVKLLAIIYKQFVFDYHKYKLDKFDQITASLGNTTALSGPTRESFRALLVEDYQLARSSLKKLGAPFMNFSILIENLYIFISIGMYLVYMLPQIYYRFWKPFDYSFIYTLLAPERLQQSIDSLICDSVNNYIASSRVYNSVLIDKEANEAYIVKWLQEDICELGASEDKQQNIDLHVDKDLTKDAQTNKVNGPPILVQTKRIAKNHRFLVQQVKRMAKNGLFQPLNRRCEWLKDIAGVYGRISVSVFVFLITVEFMIQFWVPRSSLMDAEVESDLMDVVFQVELIICLGAAILTGSFYVTLVAMICLDQLYFVSKLSELINLCILQNADRLSDYLKHDVMDINKNQFFSKNYSIGDIRKTSLVKLPEKSHSLVAQTFFGRLSNPWTLLASSKLIRHASTGHSPLGDRTEGPRRLTTRSMNAFDPIDESINLCLMQTLLHYKIFVRQSKPALDSIKIYTSIGICVTSIMPIVTRLLFAYLDDQQRRISILVCVVVMVYGDLGFVLIGKLHIRCLDICRHLQSLIAHSIAMDHIVRLQTGHDAYDRHLIWLLRKELNHPERLVDQFATRLIGGLSKMTYSSLIRYHFWWGVMIISITVIDPSSPNANDIFGGVWRFYSSADAHISQFLSSTAKL